MVFVPAVMGAGLVFSVTSAVRDVVRRGSGLAAERDARLRGTLVADAVLDTGADATPGRDAATRALAVRTRMAHRGALALAGAGAITFALYVAIGETANYFRAGGYVSSIAWFWSATMLVVAAALVLGVAALTAAVRHPDVPVWAWSVLRPTPLVDVDRHGYRQEGMRWVAIVSAALFTLLGVLATWPHTLEPIDEPLTALVDHRFLDRLVDAGRVFGRTHLSVALAVLVGIATTRCKRFARLFIYAIAVSLATTYALRPIVDRPRPGGGVRSFPSGHAVQATLLVVLVPLAVREIVRRRWVERVAQALLGVGLLVLTAQLVEAGRHAPSDVIGGMLLGLAVAGWVRSVVTDPDAHERCVDCVFREGVP